MNIDLDKVPLTILDAMDFLLAALTEEEKNLMERLAEDQIAVFHHTLGQEIRNMWSMWEKNTPLVNNFNSIGISHPDDMSGILLVSVWRKIHKKAIKLKEQVQAYQEFWTKEIGKPMP